MNKNGFKGKCKINKKNVSNDTLTSICVIIGSSCFFALILSACTSQPSIKSTKIPAVTVSKPDPVVTLEAERDRGGPKGPLQRKVPLVPAPAPALNSMNDAIDYSSKTIMLSIRMANLYGIQALQDYPATKKQIMKQRLEDAMRTINDIYKALLTFAPVANQPKLKQEVKAAQSSWIEMEKLLSKLPSKTRFLMVMDASDMLLDKNEKMVLYMESLSPVPIFETINTAVRQQMYSMKLSRDYLAASMGVDKEHRMDLMLDTVSIFESAMLALEGSSDNTADINGLIKSITKMQWRKVYQIVNECIENNGTKFNLFVMINFCEVLLEKTDRLTTLYTETRTVAVE